MKIKKGDNVIVLAGKDKGKTGVVERVLPKEDKVFVGGVNLSKRHVKKQGQVEGGIIDIVKPLHVSNVALVDPETKKATRVGYSVVKGVKVRISKRSGKELVETKTEGKKK